MKVDAGIVPTAEQRKVAEHGRGGMLVIGPARSGRSTALALRCARMAGDGAPLEQIALLARSRAGAARLRAQAIAAIGREPAELWVTTFEATAERLLRAHSGAIGLDPFFTVASAADRLALLLDNLDDLPLRRHEIRGNPSGVLARLVERIDLLKSEAITPEDLRDRAKAAERGAASEAEREVALREQDFAGLFERHERLLADLGTLDHAGLVIELGRLLESRADVREQVGARVGHLMVDEWEDCGAAHRGLARLLAGGNLVAACDPSQGIRGHQSELPGPIERFSSEHPEAKIVELPERPAGRQLRLWRCEGERGEAQAAARQVERLLAAGETRPDRICVAVASGWRSARLVGAALEERNLPYRFAGDTAFFERPEVRDLLAWLRMLADPSDSAAVVRALTRPPVQLRSSDLARCTTIARRRKLDMVAALEAALESPQVRPEARDKIAAFLRLQRSASAALGDLAPDVFIRRLIERVGIRRQRLFEATPEAAERLVNLSGLADRAAEWARRSPRASTRDFVRHITAVADAAELAGEDPGPPPARAVFVAEPRQLKGQAFEHVILTGLRRQTPSLDPERREWIPADLAGTERGPAISVEDLRDRLAYVAASRAAESLVLSWPEDEEAGVEPAAAFREAADRSGVEIEDQAEELFGPSESLHSSYRALRDEVLEESWRTGSALSEMRLDTAEDLDRAVARFLELIKVSALTQRPEGEPAKEAIDALNDMIGRVASESQREILRSSALDSLLFGSERTSREQRARSESGREPSLEQFIPRSGEGVALSASDVGLYQICPLRYKFARVFAIPTEPTINQRFGILIHNVLQRFHAEELEGAGEAGSIQRLLSLFESGWRRQGFGTSDDELQYRDRAVAALTRYHERHIAESSRPRWLERPFSFEIGPHRVRGRVDRIDEHPDGSYELIDYKTGEPREFGPGGEVQLGLYRLGARASWDIDPTAGTYWHVLDDERIEVAIAPDDTERVERTVLEVAAGIEAQDFEPRPEFEICSACEYRLLCPASEA